MVIVGFSGAVNSHYYVEKYKTRFVGHDSSISILINGELAFAAEEERFNLEKHTAEIPSLALKAGLKQCGLTWEDIDYFVFPWSNKRVEYFKTGINHLIVNPIWSWPQLTSAGLRVIRDGMTAQNAIAELERKMDKTLSAKVISVDHHIAHISSSFLTSGFKEAAILSIDGSGGYLSALSGEWKNGVFSQFEQIKSPNSLGILYGLFTEYLGYRSGYDEYKVMGMAAYGDSKQYQNEVNSLIKSTEQGFTTKYTGAILNLPYCMQQLEKLFRFKKRNPNERLTQKHFNLAASIQFLIEQEVIKLSKRLSQKTSCNNLCLSGGVFQNTVVNGKIIAEKLFDKVYIPPVPGDNGLSLGASLYASSQIFNESYILKDIGYTGPCYGEISYAKALKQKEHEIVYERTDSIAKSAAALLAKNKVVAWFQGEMEFGARALGNRSILASPLPEEMKDTLNLSIKNREPFRPFAASICNEYVTKYFEIDQDSPYMQFVVPIRPEFIHELKAINHFKSCRIQTVKKNNNPLFHELLMSFGQLTGHPIVLNTSFNGKDQPIICTPEQAIDTFLNLQIDFLALGPYLVSRKSNN